MAVGRRWTRQQWCPGAKASAYRRCPRTEGPRQDRGQRARPLPCHRARLDRAKGDRARRGSGLSPRHRPLDHRIAHARVPALDAQSAWPSLDGRGYRHGRALDRRGWRPRLGAARGGGLAHGYLGRPLGSEWLPTRRLLEPDHRGRRRYHIAPRTAGLRRESRSRGPRRLGLADHDVRSLAVAAVEAGAAGACARGRLGVISWITSLAEAAKSAFIEVSIR